MEPAEIAVHVRRAYIAAMLETQPEPLPVIDKLEFVMGAALIANRACELLGLLDPLNER